MRSDFMKPNCINCGNVIHTIPKRFPLCSCGHTEVYKQDSDTYAEVIWYADAIKLISPNGFEKYITAEKAIDTLLKEIVGLPIKKGKEIRDGIISCYNGEEKQFVLTLPSWAAVAYYYHKKYSTQFRYAVQKGYFNFVQEVLKSGVFLNYPQPEAFSKMDHIHKIWKIVPAEAAVIVYEALLYGYSDQEACKLGYANVRAPELLEFMSNISFGRHELIDIIYALSQRRLFKNEIFDMLTRYNKALDYMASCKYHYEPKPNLPIDTQIHYAVDEAEYCKRANEKLKHQLSEMYKKCEKVERVYLCSHDIILMPAFLQDARHFTSSIPEETIEVLPLAVMYKNKPLGLLYIGQRDIYGVWFRFLTDEMKQGINECLDAYCKSQEYSYMQKMMESIK